MILRLLHKQTERWSRGFNCLWNKRSRNFLKFFWNFFVVFAEIRQKKSISLIVRALWIVREVESYALSKFQPPTTRGDHQNVEKTIPEKSIFLGFGNQFSSFFLDFGGNRQFSASKSISSWNFVPDTPILRSVRPKIVKKRFVLRNPGLCEPCPRAHKSISMVFVGCGPFPSNIKW